MAVAVVDGLEVVEVEQQQDECIAIVPGPCAPVAQRGGEPAAIRQPGQAVAPALLLEQVALAAQFVLQVQPLAVFAMAAAQGEADVQQANAARRRIGKLCANAVAKA